MKYTYDAQGKQLMVTVQPGTLIYPVMYRMHELEPDVPSFTVVVQGKTSIMGYLPVRLDSLGKLYPKARPVMGVVQLEVRNVTSICVDTSKLSERELLQWNLVQLAEHERLTRFTRSHDDAAERLAAVRYRIAEMQARAMDVADP